MSKNRIGKYLAYAVGEIILVVIGILIAVSINNWKEERQTTTEFNAILNIVKSDLESDINEVSTTLEFLREKEAIMEKILFNDGDYLKDCFDCKTLLVSYLAPDFSSSGLELLQARTNIPQNLNFIVDDLKKLRNEKIPDIKINDDFMFDEIKNFVIELRDNTNWFKQFFIDGECEAGCETYFEGTSYLNRISLVYSIISDQQIVFLENYKNEAKKIIASIDKFNAE